MKFRVARVCRECQEVFDGAECPQCDSPIAFPLAEFTSPQGLHPVHSQRLSEGRRATDARNRWGGVVKRPLWTMRET